MQSNITTIKNTVLFGFLIDQSSAVNGFIFFFDLGTGSYLEAFQNPVFYYSETDLNVSTQNKNLFLPLFFSEFSSSHFAFVFFPFPPKVDANLRLPE